MIIKHLENLTKEMGGIKEVVTDEVTGLKSTMGKVELEVGGLKEEVSGLKRDMVELKKDVVELKKDVVELKKDVSGLKSKMEKVEGEVAGLNSQVTGLDSSVESVRSLTQQLVESAYRKHIEQAFNPSFAKSHHIQNVHDIVHLFSKGDSALPGLDTSDSNARHLFACQLAERILRENLLFDWWDVVLEDLRRRNIDVSKLEVERPHISESETVDLHCVDMKYTIPFEKAEELRATIGKHFSSNESKSIYDRIDRISPKSEGIPVPFSLLNSNGPAMLLIISKVTGKGLHCKQELELDIRGDFSILFSKTRGAVISIGEIKSNPLLYAQAQVQLRESLLLLKWCLSRLVKPEISQWMLKGHVFLPKVSDRKRERHNEIREEDISFYHHYIL